MPRDRFVHTQAGQASRRRILHVEDDPTTREAVRSILSVDHEVVSACGLTDALDFARKIEFGLYLLGCMFRDGSSLELCYELRSLDPEVPVLLHSFIPRDLRRLLLRAGASGILALRAALGLSDTHGQRDVGQRVRRPLLYPGLRPSGTMGL